MDPIITPIPISGFNPPSRNSVVALASNALYFGCPYLARLWPGFGEEEENYNISRLSPSLHLSSSREEEGRWIKHSQFYKGFGGIVGGKQQLMKNGECVLIE
jgi:hypothetical protein